MQALGRGVVLCALGSRGERTTHRCLAAARASEQGAVSAASAARKGAALQGGGTSAPPVRVPQRSLAHRQAGRRRLRGWQLRAARHGSASARQRRVAATARGATHLQGGERRREMRERRPAQSERSGLGSLQGSCELERVGKASSRLPPPGGPLPRVASSFFAAAPAQVRLTARCFYRSVHAAAPGSACRRVGASAAAERRRPCTPSGADPIALGSQRRPGPPAWRRPAPGARGARVSSAGLLGVLRWRCACRGARAGEPDHPEACRRLVLRLAALPLRFQALSTRHSVWVARGAAAPPVCGSPGAVAGGEPPAQTLGHGSHALPPPRPGPPRRRDACRACGGARPTPPVFVC